MTDQQRTVNVIFDKDYCDSVVNTEVSCPTCSAEPGWPCFTRNGRPCAAHQRRVAAWRRLHPELPPPREFVFVDGQYIPLLPVTPADASNPKEQP